MNMQTIDPKKIIVPKCSNFPQRITLELTNRCNLNCVFCPRKLMEKKLGFMNTAKAMRLIDEMADFLPITLVPFFRGESLLHPEWYTIIQYAKKKGLGPIQFTTNGTYLNETNARRIIDTVDFISFSVDTTDPKLYNETRLGSNYENVVNNILSFINLKKEQKCPTPKIQISAVETPQHKPGINDFIHFWIDKVDQVRVYAEHSTDGHPGSIGTPLPVFPQRLVCHKVMTDMIIYWDGEVALCNHDWTRHCTSDHIANVFSEGIKSAWLSPRYAEIRRQHTSGDTQNLAPCNNCDHWKMFYLKKGYLGRIYNKTDNEQTHDE